MRRLLGVVFAAAALPLAPMGLAPAAPVPKHLMAETARYYPVTAGSKWVYKRPGHDDLVLIVAKVENRQGMTIVSVESVEGSKRFPFETVEVSATGLVRTHGCAGELDPPQVLLKTPFKPRDGWEFDDPGSEISNPQKGKCVVDVDSIRVPAGTFPAARVDRDCTTTVGDREVRDVTSYWYAPNVGLVKMMDANGKNVWELKSFTPGKE